jgi:hypothetical protein
MLRPDTCVCVSADGSYPCTDKKENQIFLIYKEIQTGAIAKSYMTIGQEKEKKPADE